MKKKIILLTTILALLSAIGITYAFFNHRQVGSTNEQLIAGDIYMHYLENNTLTIQNTMPTSTYIPNKYFEFTIDGKNTTTNKNIVYEIDLNQGEAIQNKIRIKDRFLKFRLVEVNNNVETELFNDRNYATLNNKRIYVSTIPMNTTSEISKTYRLYMWIDHSVVIGNGSWADYSASDWNNVYGSIRVDVIGDFSDKTVQTEPNYVLKNLNDVQAWQNVRANVTSVEFHDDGVAPSSPISTIDVTDSTSTGDVTLYIVDDGLNNSTYKAIIVADNVIYAPENSSAMFGAANKLVTFDSRNFRVDNVTNMRGFFTNCWELVNIDSLSLWNTGNVADMGFLFNNCYALSDLTPLSNWNTGNVTTLQRAFSSCSSLTSLNGLNNWNTINLTNIQYTFMDCVNLVNIDALANWNVKKVQSFNQTFKSNAIVNVNALSSWEFKNNASFTSMFYGCGSLSNLNGISGWDVSEIRQFTYMFYDCVSLYDSSGINDWAITASNASFTSMFTGAPSHPTFSQAAGTWSNGTFTRSS